MAEPPPPELGTVGLMRIGLLGELEVRGDDGAERAITGAKLRALVALLALHAGRPVATDQLVEALWGDDPPPAVRNGLQGLVSKLRRSLGGTDAVTMRGGSYALAVEPDDVDVHRFERLVGEARAAVDGGDLAVALRALAEAEALWRGDALADFAYEEFASATIHRLTELRLGAVEERLSIELSLGHHHAVVAELEALVSSSPLRERPRGLLMLALYRAGRQADALRVFQEGRTILADELGLDPGPELRQLEAAILAHDPALDPPGTGALPAPAAAAVPRTRPTIPETLTPLIGREREVAEVRSLVDDHRLVTLVGPGGVGKTRLGVEVARGASAELADGGCLVELAPIGDPAAVRAAIATALDLPDADHLAELIGERELLVVLDNCEHVITTAAEVAEELLRRCPRLRLLATSREGLRVGGEVVWPVPPLGAGDAAELFLARAEASGARFEVTDELRSHVLDICTRLDGLPLAIELAAARTRAFPISQIAARLHDRFRLLTGGSRTALPRQQTLRAVVDWSYELLFSDEQRVFERLSVLPGGGTLATVEAVCAHGGLAAADVGDLLQALVDKSLVVAVPVDDDVRFTQLQTLAQYARERLAERGDAMAVRQAMAAHFAELCRESTLAYSGDRQRSWLRAIDQEHDNLSAALEWAVDVGDAETAMTIAGGASWPHWLGGRRVEGRRWLDAAFACEAEAEVARAGEVDERTRALALAGRGIIGIQSGAMDEADAALAEALQIFRRHDDVPGLILVHSFYAEVPVILGDVEEARRRRRAVLEFAQSQPDAPFSIASRAYSCGKLALLDGDLVQAEHFYREAANTFATIDRPVMSSLCLDVVADFEERAGNHAAAAEALAAAIATNESLGLGGFGGSLLSRLGWMRLHLGDAPGATRAYADALDLARWLDNTPVMLLALAGFAVLRRLDGDRVGAGEAATEALDAHLAGGPRRMRNRVDPDVELRTAAATACTVLAALAAADGNGDRAAALLGHAEGLRDLVGAAIPPFLDADVRAAIEEAKRTLGDEGFTAAFERGRRGRLGGEVPYRR